MDIKEPFIKLTRFRGEELYPITEAKWKLYENDDGPRQLWLEIHAIHGTQLHEDTQLLSEVACSIDTTH